MTIALGDNRYGKSGIHLVVVDRAAQDHALTDLRVDIRLEGDFDAAHTAGDNSAVVPTDTMRGTVFAFARTQPATQPEDFGLRLARHFVATVPAVTSADVRLRATPWARIGGDHPTAFLADRSVVRTAHARVDTNGAHVRGGIEDLKVFKSAASAFSEFYTDEYTTLPPTHDRMMATIVTADWGYRESTLDWDDSADAIQRILLQAFADHDSASVQHTLYAMGEAVLTQRPEVTDVHLLLPNVHHLLVDLAPYGLDNPNMVFVATPEPYGVIEATVVRDAS
jgi:urate oxidase